MGRHSLPESPGFWRSVVIAGVKYLAVAAVLAGIGFGIFKLVGGGDDNPPVVTTLPPLPTDPSDLQVNPDETPTETLPPGAIESPPPGETTPTTTTPAGATTPRPTTPAASPSPARGTGNVQMLDGSSSGIRAAKAKQAVENAGYTVVATGATSRPYEKTTVFYQPGNEDLARDVAITVGATDVLPAPANLDKTVPVAVVIGADYPG